MSVEQWFRPRTRRSFSSNCRQSASASAYSPRLNIALLRRPSRSNEEGKRPTPPIGSIPQRQTPRRLEKRRVDGEARPLSTEQRTGNPAHAQPAESRLGVSAGGAPGDMANAPGRQAERHPTGQRGRGQTHERWHGRISKEQETRSKRPAEQREKHRRKPPQVQGRATKERPSAEPGERRHRMHQSPRSRRGRESPTRRTHGRATSSRTHLRSGFAAMLGPARSQSPSRSAQVEMTPPLTSQVFRVVLTRLSSLAPVNPL